MQAVSFGECKPLKTKIDNYNDGLEHVSPWPVLVSMSSFWGVPTSKKTLNGAGLVIYLGRLDYYSRYFWFRDFKVLASQKVVPKGSVQRECLQTKMGETDFLHHL